MQSMLNAVDAEQLVAQSRADLCRIQMQTLYGDSSG